MQYYEKLSKYIKELRESHGVSLNGFCMENDLEPSTLSRIENAKLHIKIPYLIHIAKGFNKTPAELLSDFEETIK